jgi:acyl-CoA thioesterase FadM
VGGARLPQRIGDRSVDHRTQIVALAAITVELAATAFAYARRDSDADEDIRYVTASLTVDFRRPTPIGVELEITGRLKARDRRKSWIDLALSANGTECATATMLAIRLRPENRSS